MAKCFIKSRGEAWEWEDQKFNKVLLFHWSEVESGDNNGVFVKGTFSQTFFLWKQSYVKPHHCMLGIFGNTAEHSKIKY